MFDQRAITVLLIDDDVRVLTEVSRALTGHGLRALCAESPFEIGPLVDEQRPDVIVLDCRLPDLLAAIVAAVQTTTA